MIVTSSKSIMEPPPRPPKCAHLQNRRLSPSSIERIQRRQSCHKHVKFKPPAPDPQPAPPDLQVTNEWLKQMTSSSSDLIPSQHGLDNSDSGCSSLASRSPSTATSPLNSGGFRSNLGTVETFSSPQPLPPDSSLNLAVRINSPPDLLIWSIKEPATLSQVCIHSCSLLLSLNGDRVLFFYSRIWLHK